MERGRIHKGLESGQLDGGQAHVAGYPKGGDEVTACCFRRR
jgi:hypothetical protein